MKLFYVDEKPDVKAIHDIASAGYGTKHPEHILGYAGCFLFSLQDVYVSDCIEANLAHNAKLGDRLMDFIDRFKSCDFGEITRKEENHNTDERFISGSSCYMIARYKYGNATICYESFLDMSLFYYKTEDISEVRRAQNDKIEKLAEERRKNREAQVFSENDIVCSLTDAALMAKYFNIHDLKQGLVSADALKAIDALYAKESEDAVTLYAYRTEEELNRRLQYIAMKFNAVTIEYGKQYLVRDACILYEEKKLRYILYDSTQDDKRAGSFNIIKCRKLTLKDKNNTEYAVIVPMGENNFHDNIYRCVTYGDGSVGVFKLKDKELRHQLLMHAERTHRWQRFLQTTYDAHDARARIYGSDCGKAAKAVVRQNDNSRHLTKNWKRTLLAAAEQLAIIGGILLLIWWCSN
ncbi:MAG: hypothetical protein LKJ83_09190 [Eubacteriaceae bacterium]|jgi:hypothetical protein|nr:hypothetical protein [Eubacteriaceae bacterium]